MADLSCDGPHSQTSLTKGKEVTLGERHLKSFVGNVSPHKAGGCSLTAGCWDVLSVFCMWFYLHTDTQTRSRNFLRCSSTNL